MRTLVQLAAAIGLILSPASGWAGEKEDAAREYAVKAAFLYQFAKYVEWPEGTFKDPDAPIVLGVVGVSPFGSALEELNSGARTNQRSFSIKYYRSIEERESCHMLFICSSEANHVEEILEKVGNAPVLVVGDSPGLAEKGVAINFLIEDNKVRFEANPEAAKQAHLQISSKVLRLAKAVVGPKP